MSRVDDIAARLSPQACRTLINSPLGELPRGTPAEVVTELDDAGCLGANAWCLFGVALNAFGLSVRGVVMDRALDQMDPPAAEDMDALVAAAKAWRAFWENRALDQMDPPAPDPRDELVAAAKAWRAFWENR